MQISILKYYKTIKLPKGNDVERWNSEFLAGNGGGTPMDM